MQILPNCLYVVAHGSSRTTVCVEGMHKYCAALTLHTGVLTKMFVLSVLYSKSELNCGLGAINGEDTSKAGSQGNQRPRFPVSLRGVQLARFPVCLRIRGQLARLSVSLCTGLRSHASRSVKVKQLSTRHLLQPLKTKKRGVT